MKLSNYCKSKSVVDIKSYRSINLLPINLQKQVGKPFQSPFQVSEKI